MLDVGCGRGIEVHHLRKEGWNCWGCELSACQPISEETANFIFYNTLSLDLEGKFKESVGAILFLDVIEHIENAGEFIVRHINDYGSLKYIIMTLPARNELWSNYDVYYKHHARYNIAMVTELFKDIPHKEKEVGYFFHSLYIPAWIKSKSGKREVILHAPSKRNLFLHRMAAYYFLVEERVVSPKIPGTSLYALITL